MTFDFKEVLRVAHGENVFGEVGVHSLWCTYHTCGLCGVGKGITR
jgi:hypothetical protein